MASSAALAVVPQVVSPAPLWRGVNRILLSCAAPADGWAEGAGIAERLCAVAVAEARQGAPIAIAREADVAVPGRGDAVLRLRIDRQTGGAVLLASVARAVVIDEAEGGPDGGLFARPVTLTTLDAATLRDGVARALDTALPWRRRNTQVQRSRRP
ncbi:MAG TPA: hypothetical protein VFQ57_09895 [Sphingomonas sp.]|jgi:hypothetical protein|nr:hypothetical protein [Sphingomonas sp.]